MQSYLKKLIHYIDKFDNSSNITDVIFRSDCLITSLWVGVSFVMSYELWLHVIHKSCLENDGLRLYILYKPTDISKLVALVCSVTDCDKNIWYTKKFTKNKYFQTSHLSYSYRSVRGWPTMTHRHALHTFCGWHPWLRHALDEYTWAYEWTYLSWHSTNSKCYLNYF